LNDSSQSFIPAALKKISNTKKSTKATKSMRAPKCQK
jgi:hypothetical protein